MTGWAQVNGLRGQTSIEERTRFDLFYVEHWSLRLDARNWTIFDQNVSSNSQEYTGGLAPGQPARSRGEHEELPHSLPPHSEWTKRDSNSPHERRCQ